jgi:hypothetical protein
MTPGQVRSELLIDSTRISALKRTNKQTNSKENKQTAKSATCVQVYVLT